ncbi:MAG: nucleotide sugar dehydrogenase [Bacilli bacterium]|nr:nucleotide sugar dehydrogenase [Bacilli bacterium]
MKICVIGLGYIGLPTAAMFASHGVDVTGVDISPKIVDTINAGNIHIEEPGLGEIVKDVVAKGRLHATIEPEEADVFIIAVPTPNNDDQYLSCNLDHALSATKSVMPHLRKGNVIIIESTIAPRTTEDYIKPIIEEAGFVIGKDIYLAHCPERVLPGQILDELVNNNRIVGGITAKCAEKASNIYKTFVKGEIIKTEAKTAEMSKLMENTYRDVNIALANELTKICNSLDINVLDVIEMANKHPRVNILTPGPGVGGHCLAVDPYFIYAKAPELAKIIKLARDTNRSMPNFVAENVEKILEHDTSKIISVFGVSYKPNVDDMRESPSLEIVKILNEKGYETRIHDPHIKNPEFYDFDSSLKGSDMLLCLVGHNEFKSIDMKKLSTLMKKVIVLDISNVINSDGTVEVITYGNLYEYNNSGNWEKDEN